MAHIKTGGTTKGNRDSISKRLGVKIPGGASVRTGGIIVRQRGSTFHAGKGARLGKDFTLYAMQDGIVQFITRQQRKIVQVVSSLS